MKVNILESYNDMSKAVADHIINYIENKPNSLFCFAGGDTPLKAYEYISNEINSRNIDVSKVKFVSLDEWVGIGHETKGSCIEMLYKHLYNKIPINIQEQVCFFNGKSENLEYECNRVDKFIFDNGGLDISLLGIGMNGHLGFNEPNVNPNLYCTVITLDEVTKTVGTKYFENEVKITAGITVGLKHIFKSKEVILIANGEKKADIVKKTVEGEKTIQVPSSLVNDSTNSFIYLDRSAANKLKKDSN